MEVNGTSFEGHFGSMAGDLGITYGGYFPKSGWMVEKKNVAAELVSKVATVMPEMWWMSPAVRGDTPYGEVEAPGVKRNRQRAQRRSLEVAFELSKGACRQIREGRHVAWEIPLDLRYWKECRAEQALHEAAQAAGRPLHHIIVDGFFLEPEGAHGKRWRILTTSHQLATALRRCRCPGHKEHEGTSGPVSFPKGLIKDILYG
eukprot:s5273_g1.t1